MVDIPTAATGIYACERDTDCQQGWGCSEVGYCARFDLEVTARYPLAIPGAPGESHWNHWGEITNPSAPCAPAKGPHGCVHLGELFDVVTDQASCDGLELTESLGAFAWTCVVADGRAVFRSAGLREGRTLRDLLEPDGWRPNSVFVSGPGGGHASSPGPWWRTPVAPLASRTILTRTEPSVPAVVTVHEDTALPELLIADDSIVLVTLDGARILHDGTLGMNCDFDQIAANDHCLVQATDRRWLWVEADLRASTGMGIEALLALFGVTGAIVQNGSALGPDVTTPVEVSAGTSVSAGVWVRNWRAGYVRSANTSWPSGISVSGSNQRVSDVVAFDVRRKPGGAGKGGIGIRVASDDSAALIIVERSAGIFSEQAGIRVNGGSGVLLRDVNVSFNGDSGLDSTRDASNITVDGIVASNNAQRGIWLPPFDVRIFRALVVHNGNDGITIGRHNGEISDAGRVTIGWLTTVANGNQGLWIREGYATVLQILAVNNQGAGLGFSEYIANAGPFLANIANVAAQKNTWTGIALPRGTDRISLSGALHLGGNSDPCYYYGDDPVIESDGNCGSTAASPVENPLDPRAVFGRAMADSVNGLHTGGTRTVFPTPDQPGIVAADFLVFEAPLRAWGPVGDGATHLDATARGPCKEGDPCQIWDWRLGATTSVPDGWWSGWTGGYRPFSSTSGPCATPSGLTEVVEAGGARSLVPFALELTGDGIGDDDGLCESNEHCLYAPNPGAYQGHGGLHPTTCTLATSGVSNVTLHGYAKNGVTP